MALSEFAAKMNIAEPSKVSFIIKNLYECFLQRDCSMISVNPLVLTPRKKYVAANIIINLDDDSLYR